MAESEAAICNLACGNVGESGVVISSITAPSTFEERLFAQWYPLKRDTLLKSYKKWTFATRRAYPAQLGGAPYDQTKTYAKGDCVSFAPNPALVANMPSGCSSSTFVYLSLAAGNTGNEPDASPTWWRQISRPEWDCIFQLPSDVLEIQGIYPDLRNPRDDQKVPYAIETEPSPGPGRILLTNGSRPGSAGAPSQRMIGLIYTAQITDPSQLPADVVDALSWDLSINVCTSIRKNMEEAVAATKMAAAKLAIATANDRRQQQREPPPLPSWIAARFSRGYRR